VAREVEGIGVRQGATIQCGVLRRFRGSGSFPSVFEKGQWLDPPREDG